MKREEIKKRPLSDATLSALEPTGKLYREKDSQGLYFVVNDKGGKSWQVRYKNADGKWTFTGIGSYPGLSGQSARKKAAELLDSISRGNLPHRQQRQPHSATGGQQGQPVRPAG